MQPLPPPGVLYLLPGRPNPHGAAEAQLHLLWGDATVGPIRQVVPIAGAAIPPAGEPTVRPHRLKLLHFNDLHGHLVAFAGRRSLPIFSRLAGWLRGVRARHAADPRTAVLVATGGDESGGTLFDELLGTDAETYRLHAGYRLCTEAGVDVGVIGNHELDRGAALLVHAISREAAFPVLAANVTGSPRLAACCPPAAIFVVRGLRVGFIGLTTPAQIHPELADGRRVTDPIAAAHNLIPALRPLCDVLIILSHLGYSLGQGGAVVGTAGDTELARSLPTGAVHLIVGGHTHTALNEGGLSVANVVNGVPIVQAGKFGQFVGEVDLTVGEAVTVSHARLTATIELPVDAAFERAHVRPLVARLRPWRQRVIGRVAADADLGTEAVRNALASGESALANFIADGLAAQAQAAGYPVQLAMIDATSVNCGLPVGGKLSYPAWFDVMPFADVLCLFRLSGQQLAELLQDNACRLQRPGQPHIERGFLHFSRHLRYTIELGPAFHQADARHVRVHGQPIEDCLDHVFLVASTSFLRGPAASWEARRRAEGATVFDLSEVPREHTPCYVRDLLLAHIVAHGGVLPAGGACRDGRLQVLADAALTSLGHLV